MQALQPQIEAGYDLSSVVYDQSVGQSYAFQIGRLLDLIWLHPQPAILDVATGTGIALFEALRRWPFARAAAGVDISEGMLRQAQAKALQACIPAIFIKASADRLPFDNDTFDLVICSAAFHWFPNRLHAMREMARVLRPGGLLVLQCAMSPTCKELLSLLGQVLPAVTGRPLPDISRLMPTRLELERCLHLNGLKPLYFKDYSWQSRVDQPALFWHAIATAMPHWRAGLSPYEQAAAELAMLQILEAAVPRGGISITWAACELVAQKALK